MHLQSFERQPLCHLAKATLEHSAGILHQTDFCDQGNSGHPPWYSTTHRLKQTAANDSPEVAQLDDWHGSHAGFRARGQQQVLQLQVTVDNALLMAAEAKAQDSQWACSVSGKLLSLVAINLTGMKAFERVAPSA